MQLWAHPTSRGPDSCHGISADAFPRASSMSLRSALCSFLSLVVKTLPLWAACRTPPESLFTWIQIVIPLRHFLQVNCDFMRDRSPLSSSCDHRSVRYHIYATAKWRTRAGYYPLLRYLNRFRFFC